MPIATPQGTLDFKSVDTVTFVGASSNTVIDTTTGSLGVGVDANGPTSNLHVVGHTRLEGDINMLHTSNTASIKLNSNVVTEFPRSKKFMKFPRVALTGYSQDGYVVSSTTNYYASGNPLYPWQVFNGNGYRYQSIRNDYSTSNGNYTGTVNQTNVNGSLIGGEWIQLQLPNKISLNRFTVALNMSTHGGRMGKSYILAGSNDGSTWTTVSTHTQTYGNGADGKDVNHDVNSTTMYTYYRLIATATFAAEGPYGGPWALGKWKLFGIPEYDPEADGVDVVVKSVPNVPNTDWLEVYYDAKGLDDAGVVTTVNDLKPSSMGSAINSSSVTNISVSDEAFVFNGSSSGINATLSNPQGPWVHSVSVWVKLGKDHGDYGGDNVFSIGNVAGTAQLESLRIYANDVRFVTFQGGADAVYSLPMDRNRWYHFTLTYDGGATNNSFKLFRDGIFYTGTTTATPIELNVAANALLSIGYERVRNRSHFNGSIANFRLFNRALTQDEIYQLYAYQKEYFGHGDLGMTLKAGRLGIGTSEPRAALDVRGRIMREYNPGEIIETIQGKANGRYVKVQSGTYLLPNVGAEQDLTSTFTRINGSNFDYTPPPGTTRVIYEFWFFLRRIDDSPILHVAGRVDGSHVNDARHTFRHQTDNIGTDPQIWIYNHMCVSIGEVTSDNIAGGQVATWNGPRTIDFSARRYSGSFDARLHKTNHWEGSGNDILVRPTIKITAIA